MIQRFCYHDGNMYIVDHVVRLDKTVPFKPFVYVGECEVSMHLQPSSKIKTFIITNPHIMHLDEAVSKYPEMFI